MQVIGGRYELRSLVATGGMGQVWRAHDQRLERPVAVKVLRSEYADEPEFLARFRAEARHAAMLGHRNVVAVFDYGETTAADGEALAYLVMELVPGESLAAVRRRLGALPPEQVLEVVAQAAAGLGAAHEMGIVHRDVKPANLLLRPDGSVAVTDFGIAWSAESVALTRTGQVIGTAHYLSPEQARGETATPASDVYALGMVAYELLAGRRAFEGGSSVAIALSQIQDEPEALPSTVPAPVRELVAAMLVKDAARRLPDGDAVVAAAHRARTATGAADEPTELLALVPPPGVTALLDPVLVPAEAAATTDTATSAPVRRRRRRLLLAGVLAALLLVGGGTAVLLGLGGSSAPATAAPATTTAPTSATPTPVTLDAAQYVGRPLDEVTAELTALGLQVSAEEVAGDGSDAGLVTEVAPAGTALTAGSTVTVRYGSAAPTPAPTTEPAPEPTTEAPATQVSTQEPATQEPTTEAPAGPGNGGGPGNGNGNGNGGPGNGNGNGGPGNGNGNGGPGAGGPGRGGRG